MKAKTSPTSPKYKVECLEKLYQPENLKKIEKPPKKQRGFIILVLALIFGFLAGFSGNLVFNYGLANYPDFSRALLNINSNQADIVPQKSADNKNNFTDIKQNISPSQVNIFKEKEASENDLTGVYLPQDFTGYGLILSSEGLIVTTKAAIDDFEKSYRVVTSDGKIYAASDFLLDPATNLVFLKINAQNLKAAELSDLEAVSSGQTAVIYKNSYNLKEKIIFSTQIEGRGDFDPANQEDLIKSSERMNTYLTVSERLDDSYEGCLLLDDKSKVMGLGTLKNQEEKNMFIPLANISQTLNGILKDDTVLRPYLGLHFVDLSQTLNIPPVLSRDLKKGFLVWAPKDKPAVIESSPAAKAGLKKGDIIIKINEKEIEDNFDFSQFIQGSDIGQSVILLINRDGQEIEKDITLSTNS